jgi:tetratricopeptide (TPR) repeat protein
MMTRFLFGVCCACAVVMVLLAGCKGNGEANHSATSADSSSVAANTPDPTLLELNERIEKDPNNFQHYVDRAKYYEKQLNFTEALADLARAQAVDSTQCTIYLTRGDLYWNRRTMLNTDGQSEMIALAYYEYQKCIGYDGNNTDCLLKKAGIDIAKRQYDVARDLINRALKINEYLPFAYYLRGRMYKETGDTTLAYSSYKTAIDVDPTYYDAYIEIGLIYSKEKNDLAQEYFSSAIDIKPQSVEAYYNKAMYLQETGFRDPNRYQQAFVCYDSILKIEPKFFAAYFNKGFVHLEYLQNYQGGIDEFTKAIAAFPAYYQAYYNRGLCYESLGLKASAESDYRAALGIAPTYTEAAQGLERVLKK